MLTFRFVMLCYEGHVSVLYFQLFDPWVFYYCLLLRICWRSFGRWCDCRLSEEQPIIVLFVFLLLAVFLFLFPIFNFIRFSLLLKVHQEEWMIDFDLVGMQLCVNWREEDENHQK